MINLLEANPSAAEITAVLKKAKLRPLMPAMDAPEWEAAKRKPAIQQWMKGLRELAEKESFEPLPELTEEMYGIFAKTGDRLFFETRYFERRRRLARVAMVVLLGDAATRKKFVPALIEKSEETMAEDSWTFPAHSGQPSGKDPMMIDLFASETANLMGELLTPFGAVIPAELAQRIKARLRKEYFENYMTGTFHWQTGISNWNAVCHEGVIGAALAVETDMDLLGRMLEKTGPRLQIFIDAFGNDGSTSEGPGYWSYGYGRFVELNKQLETATGGDLSVFGTNEKVKRIAAFAPAMVFSGGHFVNFSDGSYKGRLNAPLLNYLGKRLEMPELCQESAAIYKTIAEEGIRYGWQRCDLFYYTRLFLNFPEDVSKAAEPKQADVFFPDYGAVVARGRDAKGNLWEFAAKGGHNEEMHNHNDCGSFILNFNGKPALFEIGAPEYVKAFFRGETRYGFLAARSLGHSVPYVNGVEQHVGVEFATKVLECKLEADKVIFVVDLMGAYPKEAKLKKLVRTLTFEKSLGCLTVSDAYEIEEAGPVESMLICFSTAQLDKAGGTILAPGGTLRFTPVSGTHATEVDLCDYSDHEGKPQTVNRVRFGPTEPAASGVIEYKIEAE